MYLCVRQMQQTRFYEHMICVVYVTGCHQINCLQSSHVSSEYPTFVDLTGFKPQQPSYDDAKLSVSVFLPLGVICKETNDLKKSPQRQD